VIARIWRGVVRAEDADEYARYILQAGFDGYKKTPGNRCVYYPQDERYLIERDLTVRHYEIAGTE
jgi:hypothetical protein